jgi:phosphoribosylglycinamide formyltransferase-1
MSLLARAPCTPEARMRVGVLVSGSGSNLQAILDRVAHETSLLDVRVVVSNVPGVRALERAATAGVPGVVVASKGRERAAFEDAVHDTLVARDVEIVALAGFMRVLTPHFLSRWSGRVVNVHPALLPSFPGMHGARQALAAGVKITGCTVHVVDAGVDTGTILAQAAVPVYPGDTEEKLQARIQENEHRLFPEVLEAIARGEL